jgi:hypothetical protein
MSNIFDLSRISKLVETQRPVCLVILDTNVLMDYPNPSAWKVLSGATIFVLSDLTIQELEFIRKRDSQRQSDSFVKATAAIKELNLILKTGNILNGIPIPSGWMIAVSSPKQTELDDELKQLDDIVKAFGRSDTKLLLLTKENSQMVETVPVIFVTSESNLFNVAQMNGVGCHLFTGFPIEKMTEIIEKIKDWDSALEQIQMTTKNHSMEVDLTLTSQAIAPQWLDTDVCSLIIANGRGVLRDKNTTLPFLWTVKYSERTLEYTSSRKQGQSQTLPSINLDFFGLDDFGQRVFDAIGDRLLQCMIPNFEEVSPILQSPEGIMEMLLYHLYEQEDRPKDFVEQQKTEIEVTEGDALEPFLLEKMVDADIQCYIDFIRILQRCWTIGYTYKFRIIV